MQTAWAAMYQHTRHYQARAWNVLTTRLNTDTALYLCTDTECTCNTASCGLAAYYVGSAEGHERRVLQSVLLMIRLNPTERLKKKTKKKRHAV